MNRNKLFKNQSPPTVRRIPKYGWIGPVLISCSPLLLRGSSGLGPKIAIFLAMALVIFVLILKYLILNKPIHRRFLDLPIIFLFLFFLFDFYKVLVGDIQIMAWVDWHKFVLILLYFPISREFFTEKRISRMFCFLIFLSSLVSLLEIHENLSIGSISALPTPGLIRSTYPMWVILFLVGIGRFIFKKNINISRTAKISFLIAFVICLIDVLSFARRTPLVLISISILLSIFFSIKFEKRIPYRLIIIVIFASGLLYYSTDFYSSYITRMKASDIKSALTQRSARYEAAWQYFLKNPVFGSYDEETPFYYYKIRKQAYVTGSIHSLYFYILAKGGLIGGLVFAFLIYKIFSFLIRVLKTNLPIKLRMYVEGSFITIAGMFISGLTSTRMFHVESWLFLGVLLGLVSSIYYITIANVRSLTIQRKNKIL